MVVSVDLVIIIHADISECANIKRMKCDYDVFIEVIIWLCSSIGTDQMWLS